MLLQAKNSNDTRVLYQAKYMGFLDLFRSRSQSTPHASLADIEALESKFRLLKAEWLDMYDKLVHLAGRLQKRDLKLVQKSEPEMPENAADPWSEAYDLARKRGFMQ